ncbi:MAG: hypothetical protein RIC80_15615 [Cyclobacteriaceae bacterium]
MAQVAVSKESISTPSRSRKWRLSSLLQWEYWPFNLLYAPILPYWIWLTIKARSFFFFTAANPGIEFGGMLGESKEKILRTIDSKYLPITVKLNEGINAQEVLQAMEEARLNFPIILKPDIGERGWGVEKITDELRLKEYLSANLPALLLQEYVDLPIELGVFYYRKPSMQKGKVSSIVLKRLLAVVGDGRSSIRQLMLQDDRAQRYVPSIAARLGSEIDAVPPNGHQVQLMPIGNHCKGTAFLDAGHEIDDALEIVFDNISKRIDGFYFGRFDIRCASFEELKRGEHFKIMELNGAGAEPGHVYNPGNSLLSAYRDIIFHLDLLADISIENMRLGVKPMGLKEGLSFLRSIRLYNRTYRS